MRLKNRREQTLSIATIMYADIRTPHYYRNQVKRQLGAEGLKSRRNVVQKTADLIAKDLPKADSVLDERANGHLRALAHGTSAEAPRIDVDWPALVHNATYASKLAEKLNIEGDPLKDDAIAKVREMRREIHDLARRIDIHFKSEHKDAGATK